MLSEINRYPQRTKMKQSLLYLFLLLSLSCEITDEGDTNLTLSETEEAKLLADEISDEKGGFMSDLAAAYETANSDFYKHSKTGIDTSFTYTWYNLDLTLAFFKKNGSEQNSFIPNLSELTSDDDYATDSISLVANGSGSESFGNIFLDLKHSFNLQMSQIVSNMFHFRGKGENKGSIFELKTKDSTLTVTRYSNYEITEALVIDNAHDDIIPESGSIQLNFISDIQLTRDGQTKDLHIERSYTISFKSSEIITLSLSTGRTVRINLLTGEIVLG